MINPSRLVSSIKMDLGLAGIKLPYDNIDELIMEIVRVKTLPVFNELSPYLVPLKIDTDQLEIAERKTKSIVYWLPDVFGDREIMMVTDIESDCDEFHQSAYDVGLFAYSGYMNFYGFQDMMLAQANANMLSTISKGPTFNFIPPNKIEIFSDYSTGNRYRLEVGLAHAENLSTIPSTSYGSFIQLATLDVKKYMFDNLKHYDNLSTSYGQLSLRIDDWSGAEGERQQLLEKWSQTYHMDLNQFIVV